MLLFSHNNYYKNQPHKQPIKKRHWCLASILIVVCSWVTHTTTASINSELSSNNDLNTKPEPFNTPNITLEPTPISNTELNNNTAILTEATPDPLFKKVIHRVKKGESLGTIFSKLDFDRSLPFKISQHELGRELVSLSIGKELAFHFDKADNLKKVSYPINALQELIVEIDDANVTGSHIYDLPYQVEQHAVSGEIVSSLYDAAIEAGLSNSLIMEMVEIYGWDIDFVMDIRKGDTFHIIYEVYNSNNEKLADGNIIAAEFTTQNQTHRAIRYTDREGKTSYYSANGKSMLGTFLRSPVEFSRISSRFGNRKHPILKTWKKHNGVDYAAPHGTPIRATADGKVTLAGTKGGYGKTVILRHAGRFSTLYAHMSRYAKGIRSGKRVKQGDIIGYIGSTGLSTGPHLHYEFRVNGVHQNPLTYKTPKASSIAASERDNFNQVSDQMIAKLIKLSKTHYAKSGNVKTKTL